MQFDVREKPDFTIIRVQFDAPGEQLLTEPGAMVARDTAVKMESSMKGGLGAALKRKLLGGESIFQSTFTASAPGQSVWIAPGPEGDVEMVNVDGVTPIFLASSAFFASAASVSLDTKWGGAKGFFSGAGLFLLKANGQGPLMFNAYGGIHTVDLSQYGGGYVVDTNHVVGWMGSMDFQVRKVGGLKSLFLSGEGLVCEFRGTGKLWLSTRNGGSLAAFLEPFRPVKSRGSLPTGD